MNTHEKLNYVEFAARDLPATKTFFSAVFGWEFVDYGPEYTAFSNQVFLDVNQRFSITNDRKKGRSKNPPQKLIIR